MDPMDQSPLGPRQKAEVGTGVAREEWDPGVWDAPPTDQLCDFGKLAQSLRASVSLSVK